MSGVTVENEAMEPIEPPFVQFKRFKVFMNHVDTFNCKHIANYLTDQIYGSLKIGAVGPEEEELGEDGPPKEIVPMPTDKYEVIGTLSTCYQKPTEDTLYILNENEVSQDILKCGFVIYDISRSPEEIPKALRALSTLTEQLEEVKKVGPKTYDAFEETKIFILISTVMTWGLTKPLDPDDPDLPFSEVDYRKRRPHPNYKQHYKCEKEVIKAGQKYKDKLKTYVISTGLTYGEEEDSLEFYFKMAWYNDVLPIIDNGNNKVPFIHVKDLARAIHGLMENAPLKPQYILAVEQTPTTLKQFIKSLSKALSDGKVTSVVPEEAFLYNNMTQTIFEQSTVNLNMEPVFLVENLQLMWLNDLNIAENMAQIAREFKKQRKLNPVKIIVHGPPASGKTQLAQKLRQHYNCHYISIQTMMEHQLSVWKEKMVKPKVEAVEYLGEEEVDEEIEDEEDLEDIRERIRELQMLMENGIESMPDDYLIKMMKSYLSQNFCQNRGYILDGYPQLPEQARALFGASEDEFGEEEEADLVDTGVILPNLIISLVASDGFITQNLMQLPEDDIKDTPYAEENILRRLEEFRRTNTDDNTVLNYFDELETDMILLDVQQDSEENFALAVQMLGEPASFGLSPEEQEELYKIEEQERLLVLEKNELEKQMELEKAEEERKNKMEAWSEILERLQMEEEKILVAQSEPLRHYLMKYVFPTLTKGLIQVATVKPDDPVDFLAEFLFKENPEAKMFDPAYTTECENLYGEFREYIEKIIDENVDQ